MQESQCENIFEYVQLQWALLDEHKPTKVPNQFDGLPQGAPTSPILSMIILKEFLQQQESLSYADDAVFFGDKEFTVKDDPNKGIILNLEKSGWVKYDGKWLKPLKFLGLKFDGTKLKAETRKGSELELTELQRELLLTAEELEESILLGYNVNNPYTHS